jgi:hypothetical protein
MIIATIYSVKYPNRRSPIVLFLKYPFGEICSEARIFSWYVRDSRISFARFRETTVFAVAGALSIDACFIGLLKRSVTMIWISTDQQFVK